MARRYNYRAVRIHRSYEVSDVADETADDTDQEDEFED